MIKSKYACEHDVSKDRLGSGSWRCCFAFFLNSDSLVIVCMCAGRLLKIWAAKYMGEN